MQARAKVFFFFFAKKKAWLADGQPPGRLVLREKVLLRLPPQRPGDRYGMVDGTVTALSRDAVLEPKGSARDAAGERRGRGDDSESKVSAPKTPSYMARVALDRSWIDTEAGRTALGAGMTVTAEVYTGRRRIISFLLSPLQRVTGESGHER